MTPASPERAEELATDVLAELRRAMRKFGPMASAHEGWAVLQEEVDELWHEVKHGQDRDRMREEAIQVAAMAMRFVHDVCEEPPVADRQGWEREDVERAAEAFSPGHLDVMRANAVQWPHAVDRRLSDMQRALEASGAVPNRVVRELVGAALFYVDVLRRARSTTPETLERARKRFDAALDAARPYLGEETR